MAQNPATTKKPDPQLRDYTSKILGINGGGADDAPIDPGTKLGPTVETLRGYNQNYGLCSENALANQWYFDNKLSVDEATKNKMSAILKDDRLAQYQKIESQYEILKERYNGPNATPEDKKKWEEIQKDRKEIDKNFASRKGAPQDAGKNKRIVKNCNADKKIACIGKKKGIKPYNKESSNAINARLDTIKAERIALGKEKSAKLAEEKVQKLKEESGLKNVENSKITDKKVKAAIKSAADKRKAADASTKIAADTANGVIKNKAPQIDFGALGAWEETHNEAYIPWWPGAVNNNAGVSVATGLDLGAQTQESLQEMGLSEGLVEKLSPYCKKKGQAACNYLAAHPFPRLSDDEVKEIDEKTFEKYATGAEDAWNKGKGRTPFRELDPKLQTVIMSRYYNQGPGWSRNNYYEEFIDAAGKNDVNAAQSAMGKATDYLRSKKSTSLANRLEKETELLK